MRHRFFSLHALPVLLMFAVLKAEGHDEWANGMAVPAWVKSSCCGPEDVHHLTAQQVRAMADGWHVEGYPDTLPYGKELPSQDGDYWIFYKVNGNLAGEHSYSPVYCFFAPPQSF